LREIASVANGRRVRHSAMNVRQVCLRVYRIICEKKMDCLRHMPDYRKTTVGPIRSSVKGSRAET